MTYIYAQIDENNKVIGISMLADKVEHPNLIPLDTYDTTLIGAVYDPATGAFTKVEEPVPPPPEPNPLEQRIIDLEIAIATLLGGGV
ncbi:hypothetical protein [Caldanaerobacter sp.]|uniref:hypothetical protein n=1 Tax=Caldanaerobacter sp. TaxID=2930036 RepID=UPI003C78B877